MKTENPFICFNKELNCGYLSNICSINKAIIQKLPLYGIADDIEGKSAIEVFSADVISSEIKKNVDKLGIDIKKCSDKDMPKYLNKCLESSDDKIRCAAEKIADKFGNRLALILLMLRVGDTENRAVRKDWNESHWSFWANVDNIILLGGIASGKLGERFKVCINDVFAEYNGVSTPNIILSKNSANAGIIGCSELLTCADGKCLVFDLGQTNIKRSIVTKQNGRVILIKALSPLMSDYVETQNTDINEKEQRAKLLHKYIVSAVCNTVTEVSKNTDLCDEMIISIANYTVGGKLDTTRGGYAKLALLGENYLDVLSRDIDLHLGRHIKLRIIHDGTAMALSFADIGNSVCISLGTAFGVGFPGIKKIL